MLYISKVFDQLLLWWMGIWMHTHTINVTYVAPDLREFNEVLGEVCVQMMPLHYVWGCLPFQTAFQFHVIQIEGVWAPSVVVGRHVDPYSHHYHHKCSPRFGRVEWSPRWSVCANDATMTWMTWLRLYNLSNCIPHPCYTSRKYLSHLNCGGWAYGCTLTPFPQQT